MTPAEWQSLYRGLHLATARYRLSFDSKRMAQESAKDRPQQALRCYDAIWRSFGAAPGEQKRGYD